MKGRQFGLITIVFALILTGCTTQKRKGDLSALGKLYHNTTAKFNGYFNANEIMIASFDKLETENQDNYNKLLKVYEYMYPENVQSVSSDLDEAMKKVSVVVNLHRPSVWTDDCYLLIGKAQFLKQDYEGAEQTLRFLISEFPPEKFEKKSKKKGSTSTSKNDEEKEVKTAKSNKREQAQKKKESIKNAKARQKEAAKKAKERKKYNAQVKKIRKKRKKGKVSGSAIKANSKDKDNTVTGTLEDSNENEVKEEENKEEEVTEPEADEQIDAPLEPISIFGKEEDAINSDPEKYFLKHRPAYQEGLLWLAKALIERDNFDGALRYIGQLEKSPATFDDIRSELNVVKAHLYIKRKQNENAIAALEQAIELLNNQQNRARLAFVAAQLSEGMGNNQAALEKYERVLKFNPDYELAFNAKLAIAQNEWINGAVSAETASSKLEKMLKDIKNEDFRDQIYYALANIALKAGNREEGIKYLQSSLKYSTKNNTQKGESYLKLGNLYFENQDYVAAKNYFDSTLIVLSDKDERYRNVKKLSDNLTDISKQLQVIALQDSLLKISELSEEDKKAFAYDLKQKQDEQRRNALVAAANSSNANTNTSAVGNKNLPAAKSTSFSNQPALQKESTFFAYNDRDLKRGKREFERKWGGRQLSDNWRLSSRLSGAQEGANVAADEIVDAAITDEDIKNILADVPQDDNARELAKLKIKEALFSLGKLYHDVLENDPKSAEALEELNSRFPGNTFELESWYYLYLAYDKMGNAAKKDEYFKKITEKYPSTNFARILLNPNFLAELQTEEEVLFNYYNNAYEDFQKGNYQQAFDKSNKAKTQFGAANALQPKFALLSAMCLGSLKGKDAYIEGLKEVVGKYPNTEEQKRAREILRLLGGGAVAALPGGTTTDANATQKFNLEDDQLHYIVISFESDTKINDKKNDISDYNLRFYKLEKLRVTPLFLGNEADSRKPLIVIRRFKNKEAAMEYYTGVQRNLKEFIRSDPDAGFQIFAISQNNYREILRAKSLDGYKTFFDENYLD